MHGIIIVGTAPPVAALLIVTMAILCPDRIENQGNHRGLPLQVVKNYLYLILCTDLNRSPPFYIRRVLRKRLAVISW